MKSFPLVWCILLVSNTFSKIKLHNTWPDLSYTVMKRLSLHRRVIFFFDTRQSFIDVFQNYLPVGKPSIWEYDFGQKLKRRIIPLNHPTRRKVFTVWNK